MNKKNQFNLSMIFGVASIILGLLPLVFASMSFISYDKIAIVHVTGYELAFGTKDITINLMATIGIILSVAGALAVLINLLVKDVKFVDFVSVALLAAAAVFLFLVSVTSDSQLLGSLVLKARMEQGLLYSVISSGVAAVLQLISVINKR